MYVHVCVREGECVFVMGILSVQIFIIYLTTVMFDNFIFESNDRLIEREIL